VVIQLMAKAAKAAKLAVVVHQVLVAAEAVLLQ
jgi:hypothetical protein